MYFSNIHETCRELYHIQNHIDAGYTILNTITGHKENKYNTNIEVYDLRDCTGYNLYDNIKQSKMVLTYKDIDGNTKEKIKRYKRCGKKLAQQNLLEFYKNKNIQV